MKILMVITGMRSGGAERVMATLCNDLCSRNEVRLLSLKESSSDYTLDKKIEFVGGNITNRSLYKSIQFVKSQIEQWEPDLILSFMTKSNIIAIVSSLSTNKKTPVVIAERANPFYTGKIYKIVRRLLYPKASGCVFQTKQAQDYYQDILKCESIVLKNPLNPDFKVEPFNGERKKKIVTMGRLSEEKNQKLLIDAFSRVAEKFSDYVVEIYGDGPLKQELSNYAMQMGVQDKVILMGRKDNIQQYISDAEIFVLPSNSEGMPNALLESMALGLACVSTDCPIGGPAVIINHNDNGVLVPINDAERMAEAIEQIIVDNDFADKLRRNACKVTLDFGTEKVCSEWEKYLLKIVE